VTNNVTQAEILDYKIRAEFIVNLFYFRNKETEANTTTII
jgi:hypothetical protein